MDKVQIQDLTVQFSGFTGTVTAVENFQLDVSSREFVCIVGPSGCGKTTVLRVLANLEKATAGYVKIIPEDQERPDYGMVFQDAGLFPWMSVLENVAYGMRMKPIFPKLSELIQSPSLIWQSISQLPQRGPQRYAEAQKWIKRVGLDKFTDAFPHQLSGGMKQRVGLARAFAYNPEVLLMDEPFGALDAQTRIVLQETLLDLWKNSDMTVLFVTHSIEEALVLADRIVVMSARPGHIIQEFGVDFPRPRDVMKLRTTTAFGQQYNNIWDILRDQVNLAQEIASA